MALTWLVGIAEWETWGVHDVDCEAPWQIATCKRVVFFFPSFYNSSFPHPFLFSRKAANPREVSELRWGAGRTPMGSAPMGQAE